MFLSVLFTFAILGAWVSYDFIGMFKLKTENYIVSRSHSPRKHPSNSKAGRAMADEGVSPEVPPSSAALTADFVSGQRSSFEADPKLRLAQ